jgi:hypothetical protein
MVLLGLILVFSAFGYDTTVHNEYAGGGTHNLGMLQMQMMLLQTGLASIVVGAILYLKQTPAPAVAVDLTPEEQAAKAERLRKAQMLNHKILIGMLVLLGVFVGAAVMLNG